MTFKPVLALAALTLLVISLRPAHADPVEVRAQLTPRRATVLSTEIAGKIVELPVREGETIKDGQQVAVLDCSTYQARLAQAKAQFDRAARKAQAIRHLDERGATGKIDLDLAIIDKAAAEAEMRLAQIDVSRCTITAPFDGSVVEIKAQRFQYVPLGEPLMDILSDKDIEVELVAPSRWLAWLEAGQRFQVRVEEFGQEYPAEVTRIGARIDPVSQTVKVYGRIDGSFEKLRTGMSGAAIFSSPLEASAQP